MRSALLAAAVVLAASSGCPERSSTPTSEPVPDEADRTAEETSESRTEPPWPADMPSMLTCQADQDCVYVANHYPTSPCCDTIGERGVRADWYRRVGELRQSGACAGVACPPLGMPSAASHGPGVPGCRARCEAETCGFVCDVAPP